MRALTAVRVDGRADDVGLLVRDDLGATVTRTTGAVEDATDEVGAHGELEHVTKESHAGLAVDLGGAFEHLHDDHVVGRVEHLAVLDVPVGGAQRDDFAVGDGSVLFRNTSGPLTSVMVRYSFPAMMIPPQFSSTVASISSTIALTMSSMRSM